MALNQQSPQHKNNGSSPHDPAPKMSGKNFVLCSLLIAASSYLALRMREAFDSDSPNHAIPSEHEPVPGAPLSLQPQVFLRAADLLGKDLPHIEIDATSGTLTDPLPRKVDIASAHTSSIVCILPGMHEANLQRRSEMWRAGWEQVTGESSCQAELVSLSQNFKAIRDRGLTLAIVSGQEIRGSATTKSGVDLLWDQKGSLARALGIEPFRYQNEEFLPRVTLLVQGGKIVAAFSATPSFEGSLLALLDEALVPQGNSNEALTPGGDAQSSQPAPSSAASEASKPDVEMQSPQPEPSSTASGKTEEKRSPAVEEAAPLDEIPLDAFVPTDALIGKKITTSPIFKVVRDAQGSWSRYEVPADKDLTSAVITIVPGPFDWSFVEGMGILQGGKHLRRVWEGIRGTSTYPSELKVFEEDAALLQKKGLKPVLMAGSEMAYSLAKLAEQHPTLSVVSDNQNSFAQSLGITPIKVWKQDFHPRLTLLVRNGIIEKAFSETSDFRKSLAEMISSVPDRVEPAPIPPKHIEHEPPAASTIFGKKFDLTTLDVTGPLPDARALGQHPLLDSNPFRPTAHAFLVTVARGLEKVRKDIGEIPQDCDVRIKVFNGHGAYGCIIDPSHLPALGGTSRSSFDQIVSGSRSLDYALERLASGAAQLNVGLLVRKKSNGAADFDFISMVGDSKASVTLEIVKK